MQGEEARARDEREGDEEQAGIGAAPGGGARRECEPDVRQGGEKDEPEVSGMVLPDDVEIRSGEEEEEAGEREREEYEGRKKRRQRSSRSSFR